MQMNRSHQFSLQSCLALLVERLVSSRWLTFSLIFMQHSKHSSRIDLLTLPFIHSFIQSFIQSFIHSFIHSFCHSFIHSFIVHLDTHSSIQVFIHTVIHSYINSCLFTLRFAPYFHFTLSLCDFSIPKIQTSMALDNFSKRLVCVFALCYVIVW